MRRPGRPRWLKRLTYLAVAGLALVSAPWLWTGLSASDHLYDEASAPTADVVIVLGTEVTAGQPSVRLAGRLQTAAMLVHSGRARAVLLSGDGHGASGDETTVMTAYLTDVLGVDGRRVVADPYGLDTYDSCVRARDVFGVTRALVVTQAYHLSRAVALCRRLGLDADGVAARCEGCGPALLASKALRDYLACGKAAWDAWRERPPAVASDPDPSLQAALALPLD
jgi:vancomycin permeability regulator SanA